MNTFRKLFSIVAVGMIGGQTVALAQSPAKITMNCTSIGNTMPEVLDALKGHSIGVANFACRVDGGPLDKGSATGQQIYEYNGPNGIGKAGSGVIRHPNGAIVWVNDKMKLDLKMQDGKVVGFDASGEGKYVMASGAAKEFEGRAYSYTAKPTGFNQFAIEVTIK